MALKDNWKAWWSFDKTNPLQDDTGSGHTLTGVNHSIGSGSSRPLNSVTLNGSNAYLTSPDASDLTFWDGTNDLPFTISFWIYPVSNGCIIQKRDGVSASNTEYVILRGGTGQIEFTLCRTNDSTNRIRITSTTNAVPTTTWTHVVLTYDGSKTTTGMKMYINSVLNGVSTNTAGTYVGMQNSTAPIYIGVNKTTSFNTYLTGSLDSIGIRSGVTTQSEVNLLYNGGLGLNPLDSSSLGIMQFFKQ